MEYFISTHGGRKGAADTALKTADSGYLTRRLVDASSDTVILELDCGTTQGIDVDPLRFSRTEIMEAIEDRIYGRVAAQPVVDPSTGEILIEANQWITQEIAEHVGRLVCEMPLRGPAQRERLIGTKTVDEIRDPKTQRVIMKADELITPRQIEAVKAAGIKKLHVRPRVVIRSAMTCETANGICQLCYGYDMSNHLPVEMGTAVGVIAAQSVGEPGTQLTMRTFHTGGVAGEDITQGLPRAEELFEARKTIKSGEAGLSPLDGYITDITTTATGEDQVEVTGDLRTARIPSALVRAEVGDEIEAKDLIDAASPCAGEVVFIDVAKGGQEMFVIDVENGDRSYLLPPVARSKVDSGERVSEGDALTERFNVEGVVADPRGSIRLSKENERGFELVDEDGVATEHEIPYGARLMVEPGAKVQEGDQITSRSKPIFIAAEGEGVAEVLPDRIVVYNPDGLASRIPLTSDLRPLKRHGDTVKAGEQLVALEIAHEGHIRVDSIEKRRGITTVHLEPKSVVKIDKAVTVRVGDKVEEGDLLTKGVVAPHTLLEAAGVQKARQYLMNEIHKVYKQQGVDINDKHLEVIIRQILNNVRIIDRGDSRFLIGDLVTLEEFRKEIRDLAAWNDETERLRADAIGSELAEDIAAGGHIIATAGEALTQEAISRADRMGIELVRVHRDDEIAEVPIAEKRLPDGERELLRISKAALQTKGWLSAASFQRTTKVLSEAALRGEVDELGGLKPSIIVGKRIPSGTGFAFYDRRELEDDEITEEGEPIAVGEESVEPSEG
jgi:DNA-directed RNA polymerase subunit beta'